MRQLPSFFNPGIIILYLACIIWISGLSRATPEPDDVNEVPIPEDGDNQVDIPDVRNPLEVQDFQHMQDLIYPLAQSECFGVDIYLRVLEFIHQIRV